MTTDNRLMPQQAFAARERLEQIDAEGNPLEEALSHRVRDITLEDAHHVLWVADRHRIDASGAVIFYRQPGSFSEALVRAAFAADLNNLRKLGRGFPGVAAAVFLYKNTEGGRDYLIGLTRGENDG